MISLLMANKWWILLISETVAWIATFYMAYARYWIKSNFQFIVSGAVAIITGYVPHITLGILDYLKYDKINLFNGFVLVLLILGITVFKKYVVEIDNKIKDWANKKHLKAAQLKE
jgi:hypothetical protein